MEHKRFMEEPIPYTLPRHEVAKAVADICRRPGVSEATTYLLNKRYANFGVADLRALRQRREENTQLKRLFADLTLDEQILSGIAAKRPGHPLTCFG